MSDQSNTSIDRVVVVVDDLDAVVSDLDAAFGIELSVIDVASHGIRVALGPGGLELVEKTSEDSPAQQFWAGPLAALVLRVSDAEEASQKLQDAGFELDHVTDVANGAKEYSFAKNFHGLPLVLYSGPPVHE